jgi:hypothetical protein
VIRYVNSDGEEVEEEQDDGAEYQQQQQTQQKKTVIKKTKTIVQAPDNDPLLYVDVNLGTGTQRIVIFEGDTAEGLAQKFATEHKLDEVMKGKLAAMLQQQIDGVLEKIDEEQASNSSDINNHNDN